MTASFGFIRPSSKGSRYGSRFYPGQRRPVRAKAGPFPRQGVRRGGSLTAGKPDTRHRHFRCALTDPEAKLPAGTGAILRVLSETQIVVLQHAQNVGHVLPEDTAALIEAMRRNHAHGGILTVIVVEEPDFNGEFIVRAKKPLK